MSFRYIIFLSAILFNCSTPKSTDTAKIDSVRLPIEPFLPINDSLSYIGFIEKFEETGEFFPDLSLGESVDIKNWTVARNLGDSVIYRDKNTFNVRTRIPIEKTYRFFDLTGLAEIKIYNSKNQNVATGKFKRIEYFEGSIDESFVSVFQVDKSNIEDYQYCIGNFNRRFDSLSYRIYNDEGLDEGLKEYLKWDGEKMWRVSHYQLLEPESIFSFATVDTTSYVVETTGTDLNILYRSKWNEAISEIIIIPIYIKRKPIFLIRAGYYQSDISWNYLLVFNGQDYQISKRNRIKYDDF